MQSSTALTQWKKTEELAFLTEVSSVPLQQALRHLQTAFGNFFAQRAKYPRFKSRKKSRASAEYTRSAFTWREGRLTLAKMAGPLDIRWSRPLPEGSEPTTVTVSRDSAGRWFVSLLCDDGITPAPATKNAVGIDAGITSLVTLSTGERSPTPGTSGATAGRYLAEAGLPEVAAVDVGGRQQHVLGRDWRWQTVEQWVQHRARAAVAPLATWPATASESGPGDQLPRAAFEEGMVEALRTWHTSREFAASALLHSHLVPPGSPDPVADLRGAIITALDALQINSAGVKAHEALTATYRRHLALAKERLIDHLLRQPATTSTPTPPHLLSEERDLRFRRPG
ncbi:hypothetical protein M2283_009902 [Streptomyces pseudovenezuelae]|uniref:Transposase n=1 Tax=Streptomyces pseudovenezuelae TaxID=67350 RepID=A0ABT6M3H9_9ACTN|nr:hypothetical protein [Streptomyces pseudovenezuelae]